MFSQLIQDFITREQLPDSYAEDTQQYLLPLAETLLTSIQENTEPRAPIIGINGAQGTGKSTLAALLTHYFEAQSLTVANLSIDDFYLSKAKRIELADIGHPLLRSRGVPGTHDHSLLRMTLRRLQVADKGDVITIPRFDKSQDDCVPLTDCPAISGPVDVVILEGWFVGVAAEPKEALQQPINELESTEDPDGTWRTYVNTVLDHYYQPIWDLLHQLILLKAPSFEQVFEWRSLQEEKLRLRSAADAPGLMDSEEIARFIQHFERLTRWSLATLPELADTVLEMDAAHRIVRSFNNY